MLLAAGHSKDDIPATLVREKMSHPDLSFQYGRALGIRPEHFRKEGEAALEVIVEIVENLGGETYVYARQGTSDILTIATGGVRGVRQGDRMTARFDPSDVLLFTPDGMRIR